MLLKNLAADRIDLDLEAALKAGAVEAEIESADAAKQRSVGHARKLARHAARPGAQGGVHLGA